MTLAAAAKLSGSFDAQGRFIVAVSAGIPGQAYWIQRSLNLADWSDVQAGVMPASGAVEYENPPAEIGSPAAYFRLQVRP